MIGLDQVSVASVACQDLGLLDASNKLYEAVNHTLPKIAAAVETVQKSDTSLQTTEMFVVMLYSTSSKRDQ